MIICVEAQNVQPGCIDVAGAAYARGPVDACSGINRAFLTRSPINSRNLRNSAVLAHAKGRVVAWWAPLAACAVSARAVACEADGAALAIEADGTARARRAGE